MKKPLLSNSISTHKAANGVSENDAVLLEPHPLSTCEKVKEFRGNLIASVAHDLRTPLQCIIGYAETMSLKQSSLSSTEQENYLNIILKSANKLSWMIEQFFEYSKLDVSEITPQKTHFLPKRIKTDLAQNYEFITSNKNIELQIELEENMPPIYGDYSMIYRVFQNIIDNAIKFTPEQGKITVGFKKHSSDRVCISIADTGKGICHEDLDSIFNKFQTTKETSTTNIENDGMGLGLAIVKKILSLHDAEIFVQSELGVGTTFTFYLPVLE